MTRRWEPGWRRTVDGVTLRVEPGKKESRVVGEQDLRMDVWLPGGWKPVHMSLGCVVADFFCENEDILYPASQGYLGGDYFLRALAQARRDGWEVASGHIRSESDAARRRRNTPSGQNPDGTWGELGWFTEALYREWG